MAVIVDGNVEAAKIAELKGIRTQRIWWRTVLSVVTVGYVAFCLVRLNTSVRGLATEGPMQEEFMHNLNSQLQADTIPLIQREATSTMTEMQPEVKLAVMKLKDRVPELTQAAQSEILTLQESLPARGEAILNKRFASILASREPQIRKMYPQATPEQISLLTTNLQEHGRLQMLAANNEIFGPHQAKIYSILRNMSVIRNEEAHNVKTDEPDWEMAVLLLDIFRTEFKGVEADQMKKDQELAAIVKKTSTKGALASATTK